MQTIFGFPQRVRCVRSGIGESGNWGDIVNSPGVVGVYNLYGDFAEASLSVGPVASVRPVDPKQCNGGEQ